MTSGLFVFAAAVGAIDKDKESLPVKIKRLTEQLQEDPLDTKVIFELHQSRQEHHQQQDMSLDVLVVGLRAYRQGNGQAALKWLEQAGQSPMAVELVQRFFSESLTHITEDARGMADASHCQDCGDTGHMDCPGCEGIAKIRCPRCKGAGDIRDRTAPPAHVTCDRCNGWGRVPCPKCKAAGTLPCQCDHSQKQSQKTNATFKIDKKLDALTGAMGYLRAGGIDLYTQNGLEKAPQ